MKLHNYIFLASFSFLMACSPASNNEASMASSSQVDNTNAIQIQTKSYTIPTLPYKAKYTFQTVVFEKGDMAVVNKINAALQENEKQTIVINYGEGVLSGNSTQDLINAEVQKWHNDFHEDSKNDPYYEGFVKEISYTVKAINTIIVVEKNFYSMLGVSVRDHREKEYLVFDAKTGKQLKGAQDFFNNTKAVENIIKPLFTKEHGLILDPVESTPVFILPENIFLTDTEVVFLYTAKELGYNEDNIEFKVDKSLLKDYLLY